MSNPDINCSTRTSFDAFTPGSSLEVAVMVSFLAVSSAETFNIPSAFIVVLSAAAPATVHVTVLSAFSEPVTSAIYRLSSVGRITSFPWMEISVTNCFITTSFVADILGSTFDTAVTVILSAFSSAPTVSFPSGSILVSGELFPIMFHKIVLSFIISSFVVATVAVHFWDSSGFISSFA